MVEANFLLYIIRLHIKIFVLFEFCQKCIAKLYAIFENDMVDVKIVSIALFHYGYTRF